jgi:polyisoprenoid-binding protein YceI
LKFDAGAQKFVARTRIQRSAFKMTKYRSFVGDEVDLEIEAIARPQRAK